MPTTPGTDLLRQALAAARGNDPARTRELVREATRVDPRNEAAWQWLAAVAETGAEAVAALERVVAINPHNDTARAALREVRLQTGIEAAKAKDIPTAQRLLRAAVADDPQAEQGWFWLAAVCDTPSEALAHLQRVIALNPNNAAARKGIEYYQAKLRKAAESGATPVAEKPPSSVTRSGLHSAARPGVGSGRVHTPPPAPTPAPASSQRILVADSSRTIRKLVALTAGAEGYVVSEAGDAAEAAGLLMEGGPPALVIIEAALPGADGYEFCKLVRNTPATRKVPVVLLTGKDGLFDKLRGAVAGVDSVLHKPLDPEELLRTVRSYCPTEPAAV